MLNESLRNNGCPDSSLAAALTVLSDGKPRKAAEIVADAVKLGLLQPTTRANSMESSLKDYISRTVARGNKPFLVQNPIGHLFRINHPADDWPTFELPPRPRYTSKVALDALSERLRAAAVGPDAVAFERAVCDAFTMLGFVATHMGGSDAPDGTLDAPLGPVAYTIVLECKSAPTGGIVNAPRPEEPAKYRDALHADYAVLVGPAFADGAGLVSEIMLHRVSVWTVDDLIVAIANDVDAYECRDLLVPGFVRDGLGDLVWSRAHGKEKRVAVLRDILRREGYTQQRKLVGRAQRADMPVLTLDAATILVETALQRDGATVGVSRAEIQQAMSELIHADEAAVVPGREGIIIRRGNGLTPA